MCDGCRRCDEHIIGRKLKVMGGGRVKYRDNALGILTQYISNNFFIKLYSIHLRY